MVQKSYPYFNINVRISNKRNHIPTLLKTHIYDKLMKEKKEAGKSHEESIGSNVYLQW